jgi:hypothetical protein
MAMNFPASPTNGQVYNPAPGVSYAWNGSAWVGSAQSTFPDAPADTKLYGRKDAGWTEALHRLNPAALGSMTVQTDITAGGVVRGAGIMATAGAFLASGWNTDANQGVVFLNSAQDRFLQYDGDSYEMPGAPLHVGGALTAGGAITANGPVLAGTASFGTDGNSYGTAWGAGGDFLSTWLNSSFVYRDNQIATKANIDGSNAGVFYVRGNVWSQNWNYIGYSGAWPNFNVQVDQSYAGYMVCTGNFTAYFAMRRTGNVYVGHQTTPRQQDVPAGAFMTGLSLAGAPANSMSIAYSYLQWYWNGTYYTVAG